MKSTDCLTDFELWSILDEAISLRQEQHLIECDKCRNRRDELIELHNEFDHLLSSISLHESESTPLQSVRRKNLDDRSQVESIHQISRYRIIRSLSFGGQGHVFLAEDVQLNRLVAIKISHSSISENVVASELILSEGEMLAKVNHPQLAHVYDAGIEDGRPYIVMEYVEGQTLKDYLQFKTLTDSEIRRMILEISSAILAIHGCGILHLDLKPENVIVNSQGKCKVVDLGMSWFRSPVESVEPEIIGGTPEYMSPEQVLENQDQIGPWTDVFGLGALLFSMIANLDNEEKNLRDPSTPYLWEYGPYRLNNIRCHKHLRKTCLKALAENAEDRYRSVTEFVHSLEVTERRRQAGYLVSIGALSFFIGMYQLAQYLPLEKNIHQQRQAAFVNQDEIYLNQIHAKQTYVQLHGINFPPGPMHFCIWSGASNLNFLPALREVNEEGIEVLRARTHRNGIELQYGDQPFAIIVIAGEFTGPSGTPSLRRSILLELDELNLDLSAAFRKCQLMFFSNGSFEKVEIVKYSNVRNIEFFQIQPGANHFNRATNEFPDS